VTIKPHETTDPHGATKPPIVEIRSVTKRFGPVTVLDDVSLTVECGKTTSLVGESGSGKSTLARIVTGLETADSGALPGRCNEP
jgi:ABC-type sugar transport system ATPase subunit